MKYRATYILLLVFLARLGCSQTAALDLGEVPKNNFSINFLGDASVVSFNYERILLTRSSYNFTGKFGVGLNTGVVSDPAITYPHQISFNKRLDKKMNFIELGLGGTFVNYEPGHDYSLYPVLGFRSYMSKKSDVLLRFFFCPTITQAEGTIHFPFGFSLGAAFNK